MFGRQSSTGSTPKSGGGLASSTSSTMKSMSSALSSGVSSISSIPNVAMPSIKMNEKFGKMTSAAKKMGAGLATIPINLTAAGDSAERRAKQRQEQVREVLTILEDVRLQCPQTHTGLILAYTGGYTMSPVIHPGVKFTWYRMRADVNRLDLVEASRNAWYPPTADDIGCMITVQCEDNFEQGCSRYVECGPIKVDPLLCSWAESAVENSSFEAMEMKVSFGLRVERQTVVGPLPIEAEDPEFVGGTYSAAAAAAGGAGGGRGSGSGDAFHHHDHPYGEGAMEPHSGNDTIGTAESGAAAVGGGRGKRAEILPRTETVLSQARSLSFLQLNGMSSIEVDAEGVFISIPSTRSANNHHHSGTAATDATASSSGGDAKRGAAASSSSGGGHKKQNKQRYRTRRGLRIPASTQLRVECVQPLAVILTVPITQQNNTMQDSSSNSSSDNITMSSNGGESSPVHNPPPPPAAAFGSRSGHSGKGEKLMSAVEVKQVVAEVGAALAKGKEKEKEKAREMEKAASGGTLAAGKLKLSDVVDCGTSAAGVSDVTTNDELSEGTKRGEQEQAVGGTASADEKTIASTTAAPSRTAEEIAREKEEEERRMQKFLTSSIVAIPWVYEGWHSPEVEAYTTEAEEAQSLLTEEEKQRRIQAAEEDALAYANTVVGLAEFISSLPEGTQELRICFSCSDRLERDALALSIRAICTSPPGSTLLERMRLLPWHRDSAAEEQAQAQIVASLALMHSSTAAAASAAGGYAVGGDRAEGSSCNAGALNAADGSSSGVDERSIRKIESGFGFGTEREGGFELSGAGGADMGEGGEDFRRRIRALEEENVDLKRERKELTSQLLDQREEMVRIKMKAQQHQQQHHSPVAGSASNSANILSVHLEQDSASSTVSSSSLSTVPLFGASSAALTAAAGGDGAQQVQREIKFDGQGHEEETKKYGAAVSAGAFSGVGTGGEGLADDSISGRDMYKQLSETVIELENKVAIYTKKELESAKVRTELEARNARLQADVERYHKQRDDLRGRLDALQLLYDRQVARIVSLEDKEISLQAVVQQKDAQIAQLEKLHEEIADREKTIDQLRGELAGQEQQLSVKNQRIVDLQEEVADARAEQREERAEMERQMEEAMLECKDKEAEVATLARRMQECEQEIAEAKILRERLAEARSKADKLAGEINHLHRRSESQSRDLKKSLRESAVTLAEYEKALVRKSDECNQLQQRLDVIVEEEAALRRASASSRIAAKGDQLKDSSQHAARVMSGLLSRSFISLTGDKAGGAGGMSRAGSEHDVDANARTTGGERGGGRSGSITSDEGSLARSGQREDGAFDSSMTGTADNIRPDEAAGAACDRAAGTPTSIAGKTSGSNNSGNSISGKAAGVGGANLRSSLSAAKSIFKRSSLPGTAATSCPSDAGDDSSSISNNNAISDDTPDAHPISETARG